MKLDLKKIVLQDPQMELKLTSELKLPEYLVDYEDIKVKLAVEEYADYCLLSVETKCNLGVLCQRCMTTFTYPFMHMSIFAVSREQENIERLQENYDTIYAPNMFVDIDDIVVDDIILNAVDKHHDVLHCDPGVYDYLTRSS